jgi:hypothetical protein
LSFKTRHLIRSGETCHMSPYTDRWIYSRAGQHLFHSEDSSSHPHGLRAGALCAYTVQATRMSAATWPRPEAGQVTRISAENRPQHVYRRFSKAVPLRSLETGGSNASNLTHRPVALQLCAVGNRFRCCTRLFSCLFFDCSKNNLRIVINEHVGNADFAFNFPAALGLSIANFLLLKGNLTYCHP